MEKFGDIDYLPTYEEAEELMIFLDDKYHDYGYEDDNPLCGDRVRIEVRVDEKEMIIEAAFEGEGCAISMASADMLVESVVGKSLEEVKGLGKEYLLDMIGIELGPVRLKCALLSLKVLKAGVYGLEELEEELASV